MITLKVETHDGNSYMVDVETYDAVTLNDQLNNDQLNTVVIGNMVISRVNFKSAIPNIAE